jgi:hypothetical protein
MLRFRSCEFVSFSASNRGVCGVVSRRIQECPCTGISFVCEIPKSSALNAGQIVGKVPVFRIRVMEMAVQVICINRRY